MDGPQSHRIEVVGLHYLGRHDPGLSSDAYADRSARRRSDAFEHVAGRVPNVEEVRVGIRSRATAGVVARKHRDQTIRLRAGERTQKQSVDQRENGDVRTDADGQDRSTATRTTRRRSARRLQARRSRTRGRSATSTSPGTVRSPSANRTRAHAQPGRRACGAQVFQDGLEAVERASRPVLADFAEQAVFDRIPFRRGRGVVGHGHAQAVAVAEAMLQVEFPGARRAAVAAAAVSVVSRLPTVPSRLR